MFMNPYLRANIYVVRRQHGLKLTSYQVLTRTLSAKIGRALTSKPDRSAVDCSKRLGYVWSVQATNRGSPRSEENEERKRVKFKVGA